MDTESSIKERAYHLWEKEGRPQGREAEFWERARLMHETDAKPAQMTPLAARTEEEKEVDEAMKGSFPASDPPAFTGTAAKGSAAKKPGGKSGAKARSKA